MGDLIYRQEAIDDLHGKDPSQVWDTADIEVWINSFPSAQQVRTQMSSADDLISRQAAIDAIIGRTGIVIMDEQWLSGHAKCELEIIDIINDLPCAQPKTAKIIIGKSRNGMTMWYQCDNCNEPVDENDLYCRGCGRRFEHGSDFKKSGD